MLFILVFCFTLFILLIIWDKLDIKKDPYFIRVRKELYDVEIEYIVDVWEKTEKEISRSEISRKHFANTERERFCQLIVKIIKLSEKFSLEEIIPYAVGLEEQTTQVQPYTEWSLKRLEGIVIQSIENEKLHQIEFKKFIDIYIFRIENIFDKY